MATSNGARVLSGRSLKAKEGGLELLSPEGSSVYMTEVKLDGDDLYHHQSNSNPITSTEGNMIIGVPRKPQVSLQQTPTDETSQVTTVQHVDDQLSELSISKAVAIEGPSKDEESSSGESESETVEGILQSAGVEFELSSLQATSDGKAPLELVSQFLSCVMNEEFAAAKILCEKVMELEPQNQLPVEFYPVIVERLKLDAELPTESSSSESESDGEINFVSSGEDSSSSDSEDDGGGGDMASSTQGGHGHSHKGCTHSH